MLTDAEHVECGDRSLEPLEPELADRLHVDPVLDLRVEALRDEDLAGLSRSFGRNVRWRHFRNRCLSWRALGERPS